MAGLTGALPGGSKGRLERAGPEAERPRAGPAPTPAPAAADEGAGRGPGAPGSGSPPPERPVASPPRAAALRGAPPSPPAPAADAASAAPAGPSGRPRPVTILPAPTEEEYENLREAMQETSVSEDDEARAEFEQLCGHRGLAAARCWRRYMALRGAAGPTPAAAALLPLVLDALEPSELLQGGTQHVRNLARALKPELRPSVGNRDRPAYGLDAEDELSYCNIEYVQQYWALAGHKLAGAYLAQAVVCAGVPGMAAVRADALDRATCMLTAFERLGGTLDPLRCRLDFERARDHVASGRKPSLSEATDLLYKTARYCEDRFGPALSAIDMEEAVAAAAAAAAEAAAASGPGAGAGAGSEACVLRAPGPFVADGVAWAPDEFQSWTSDADDLIGVDLVMLWQARELLLPCYQADSSRRHLAEALAVTSTGLGAHLRRQARALLAAAPPEAALAPLRGDAILIASRVQAELLSELTIAGEARAEPAARAAAADSEADIDPTDDDLEKEINFLNSSGPLARKALDHVTESSHLFDEGHERLALEAIERAQLAAAGCSQRVQASVTFLIEECLLLSGMRLGEAAAPPQSSAGMRSAQPARGSAGTAADAGWGSDTDSETDANSSEGSMMVHLLADLESVGPEGQRAAKLIRAADALIGDQRWEEARRMVAAVKQAAADGPLLIRESVVFFARELARILEKCSGAASAGAGAESSGRPGYTLDEAINIIQGSGPAGREALAQLDAAERLLK